MKFIVTDIKRAFSEPSFFVSIVIGVALVFIGLIFSHESDRLFLSAQSFALPFAAPLLSALPYSVMLMREKETGFKLMMSSKLGNKSYLFKRFIVCGLSGAAVLFIPQLILFIVCIFLNSNDDIMYNALVLALSLPFGFSYAVFSYGLSFVNKFKYIPLVMPEVLYLMCIYAFPYLGLTEIYPPLDISPTIYGGEISGIRLVIPFILTAVGALLTFLGKAGQRR